MERGHLIMLREMIKLRRASVVPVLLMKRGNRQRRWHGSNCGMRVASAAMLFTRICWIGVVDIDVRRLLWLGRGVEVELII